MQEIADLSSKKAENWIGLSHRPDIPTIETARLAVRAYLVLYDRARYTAYRGEELEVLARRQQVEEDVVLRAYAGHAADRPHVVAVTHVVAEDQSGAGGGRGEAREDVEEGGLAGAVVAEYSGDLALVDGQIDAVHRLGLWAPALLVRLVQIGYPDRLATLHLAHHRLYVAVCLLAGDEGVRLAIRRRNL